MNKSLSYFIVFSASFCLMVLELIAGRLIAPFVGVSIYTWTSVIGIVLAGITFGNWAGGRLADRYPSTKTLGWIFILSSLATVMIIFIVDPLWRNIIKSEASLELNVAFRSLLTFFPVGFMLSLVTPLVIKLRLHNLDQTGRTVGNIYGWSAGGSIAGTFLTGFWLVAKFGTFNIVWGVFAVLVSLGFLFLLKSRPIGKVPVIIAVLAITPLAVFGFVKDSVCHFESQYYCIRIGEEARSGTMGRTLILDALDHGYLLPPDIDPFGYDTFRLFAALVNYKFPELASGAEIDSAPSASLGDTTSDFNVLVIGGGAYILPRYLLDTYPGAEVTVFEIDQEVTELNYSELGLEHDKRLQILHGDGRFLMNKLGDNKKFDFIFIDAFSDFLVPHHLTTVEFIKLAKNHLNAGGIYFMHLIDSYKHGEFLSSNLVTLNEAFQNVYLMPMNDGAWQTFNRHTFVVTGTDKAIEQNGWDKAEPINDPLWKDVPDKARQGFKTAIPFENPVLREYISRAEGIILTDNYAPVENMLAPLFLEQ